MPIPKCKVDQAGPFAKWLMANLNAHSTTRTKLADSCRMTRKTVLKHCKGYPPKFTDVIAYCWYFTKASGYFHNPEEIWEIVVKEFKIDDERYY